MYALYVPQTQPLLRKARQLLHAFASRTGQGLMEDNVGLAQKGSLKQEQDLQPAVTSRQEKIPVQVGCQQSQHAQPVWQESSRARLDSAVATTARQAPTRLLVALQRQAAAAMQDGQDLLEDLVPLVPLAPRLFMSSKWQYRYP